MLEFKNSNETFWVIFKHCAFVAINAINFIIVIRLIFFILNAIWPFLGSYVTLKLALHVINIQTGRS